MERPQVFAKAMSVTQVLRYAVVSTVAFVGCSGALSSSSSDLTRSVGNCSPFPCIKVDIPAPPALPVELSATARSIVDREIRKSLYAPLDVETDVTTKESILAELKARLEEYNGQSDTPIDWTLQRSATVLFSNSEVVSVEVANEGFLGGAHGFNERTLMTFDSKTGARLGVADVVDDSSQKVLSKVVEAEFRRTRAIPGSQTLQDAGFFILPGQEMPLGENFALTDKGLEIQYNPYEVAPYSFGQTRVHIPREAVEPLVKAELRGVFASRGDLPQAR
jgi:hypothetical protein